MCTFFYYKFIWDRISQSLSAQLMIRLSRSIKELLELSRSSIVIRGWLGQHFSFFGSGRVWRLEFL